VASTLYVVDREGSLAGFPAEFLLDLDKKVEARLTEVLAGKPTPGRVIWSVTQAPPGFGLLWRQPIDSTITAMDVVPAAKGRPAEIGLMDNSHLTRYSASGELLGDAPLAADNFYYLRGGDLDGDGKNEWIAGGGEGFDLVDAAGEPYWHYSTVSSDIHIAGMMDLDGDGVREIVVQDGSSVVARKATAGRLWKTPPLGVVKAVVPDPRGTLLVQVGHDIRTIDRNGQLGEAAARTVGIEVLKKRIDGGNSQVFDILGPRYGAQVQIANDLLRDGKQEILAVDSAAVRVFSLDGKSLLTLRFPNSLMEPMAVAADLDGRPGDELLLMIPQYGLVALGVSPDAKPIVPASVADLDERGR